MANRAVKTTQAQGSAYLLSSANHPRFGHSILTNPHMSCNPGDPHSWGFESWMKRDVHPSHASDHDKPSLTRVWFCQQIHNWLAIYWIWQHIILELNTVQQLLCNSNSGRINHVLDCVCMRVWDNMCMWLREEAMVAKNVKSLQASFRSFQLLENVRAWWPRSDRPPILDIHISSICSMPLTTILFRCILLCCIWLGDLVDRQLDLNRTSTSKLDR